MDSLQSVLGNVDWDSVILGAVQIGVVITIAALASFVFVKLLSRFERELVKRGLADGETPSESRKRAQTLMGLARQAVVLTIWVLALMIILRELGVEIGPLLAGAGIVGLALGFGAQSLVSDFLAGFFLVMENQVRVGDAVRVNGTWGYVEQLNFRTLVLRDLSGEVHIFPNGTITTLSNMSHEWSAHVFEIGVAYKENTDVVAEIILEVGSGMRGEEAFAELILEDPELFGVDQFADSAVVIKGRLKTKPLKQWIVGREFNRRVKLAFDERGIEIPFPHRMVYFGEANQPFALRREDGSADGSTKEAS